ncbi:UvrD-helicase domain-containing protein [Alphaproteobacteria bacterium]|nr:UvrD-helicase domain-containing protein [Alphaproteobacteria bacterium]
MNNPFNSYQPNNKDQLDSEVYLDSLNENQKDAVKTTDGPLLVLAGAGTGKTKVLVTRISHIIKLGLAKPWEILSVTFTNKAAREMEDRVTNLVGNIVEGIWLGTFHSIGVKVLRKHAELVNISNNFTIIDTDDQIRLIKQIMKYNDIDEKRWPARSLAVIFNRWKDRGLNAEEINKNQLSDFAMGKSLDLYSQYNERLKIQNAVDFGDLLLLSVNILKNDNDISSIYQNKFKYILVDEYQDTNIAQYLMLKLIAKKNNNICCVGDDDQSIYGWRGAEVGNILRFEKDFPGAKIIRLEKNYRSQPHILAAASHLISYNEDRLGKTLWTDSEEGEKVTVNSYWDGSEEARGVSDICESFRMKGQNLNEIAILVRAGFQTREFEDRFLTTGTPYRVIGGPRFYERKEIRDVIAYLRVIAQPDDGIAFERIINVPKRGLGNVTTQAIHEIARKNNQSLILASQLLLSSDELRPQAKKSLFDLIESFNRWRALSSKINIRELLEVVLEESNYIEMWKKDKSIESPGRIENLKELLETINEYENIQSFLDHVSLVMDKQNDKNQEMINIMTLHSAKGLEFDIVFLPGWEEGLFPNQRSLEENGTSALQEERRLAHVGITRARKDLNISFAQSRRNFGEFQSAIPSRFINELPKESIHMSNNASLWNNNTFIEDEYNQDIIENDEWVSPGRKRMKEKKYITNRDGLVLSNQVNLSNNSNNKFKIGERVFHKKFGYGYILSIDSNRLDISFDKSGQKKVIDTFLEKV